MLVYGDHREIVDPRERLDAVATRLAEVVSMPPGLPRHAMLVGALIEAGQLQQGVEDEGWKAPDLTGLVHHLARCVGRSSDSKFAHVGELPKIADMLLPGRAELRLPEGFAFYAVYPEAYAAAARKLRLSGPPRVIGIRSIGTTLAAVVAAALDAPEAISVRPFGNPFARQVELPAKTVERDAHYIIVDEGPGLSGSSFGCVADWLEERGVPLDRIAFLPSHSGDPGPQASVAHRERWARAQRVAAEFDPAFLTREFGRLEELAIGTPWERLKFLADRDGGRVLVKFAGFGSIGERKLEMARALHAAGFTAEPLGLVHGFLVERWHEDARPLAGRDNPVEEIGRYIGARARLFPASADSGASIDELVTMIRRNAALGLGRDAASEADGWDVQDLSARVRRVRTDNKLDRSEWLRLPNGRLLKTDSLDHHQAHDLIGCQPVEWDIAGAIEEFDLDPAETAALIRAAGVAVDPALLAFTRCAYAAFRLGQASLAGDTSAADHYAQALRLLLHQNSCLRELAGILA